MGDNETEDTRTYCIPGEITVLLEGKPVEMHEPQALGKDQQTMQSTRTEILPEPVPEHPARSLAPFLTAGIAGVIILCAGFFIVHHHSPHKPGIAPLAYRDTIPAPVLREQSPTVADSNSGPLRDSITQPPEQAEPSPLPRAAIQPEIRSERKTGLKRDTTLQQPSSRPAPGSEPEVVEVPQKAPERQHLSADSILLEIRQQYARGDIARVGELLGGDTIQDGEYFLWLSRYLCDAGRWKDALPMEERALRTPARMMSAGQLKNECGFSRAKSLTAAFREDPSPANGKNAMEAWYDVKLQLRQTPGDAHYQYADKELRRIHQQLQGK
jgi:hypothetical protein